MDPIGSFSNRSQYKYEEVHTMNSAHNQYNLAILTNILFCSE